MRLTHFWEVYANLFVYPLETLKIPFGHFIAGSSQEYGLENEGQKFFVELCLFKYDLVVEMLIIFIVFSDGDYQVILNVGQSCFQEWISSILYSFSNPWLEMQELSLTS